MNTQEPPFDNVNVRKAMAYAYNKEGYAAEGRVDQPYQPKACVPLCAALPLREGAVPLQRA